MAHYDAGHMRGTARGRHAGQAEPALGRPRGSGGWLRTHGVTLLALALMLVGVGLLEYPSVSDWWNQYHQTKVIMTYVADVAQMTPEEIDAQLNGAIAYNRTVAREGVDWHHDEEQTRAYLAELTSPDRTVMGYVSIERIGVMLPIYHTTDENVLATSIGHLQGSSLPVGAATYDESRGAVTDPADGAHCSLSGHRGLPSARLFTDLNLLEEGDTFQLIVLDRVLTYQVDQILVTDPDDMDALEIVPGRDLCTLITCTPYGVNTHRLLVRGTRIPTPQEGRAPVPEPAWYDPVIDFLHTHIYLVMGVALGLLVLLLLALVGRAGRQRSRAKDEPRA